MEKILLVLESEALEESLEKALAHLEVRSCRPEEAGAVLARFRPDALILDLFLPGTDGFLVLEACRELPPVVLLLTVLNSDYIQARAARLGVDFLLRKPCAPEHIARYLTDMLLYRDAPDLPDNEALAEHLLSRFRIHARERVFRAMVRGILLTAEDPDCLLIKDIYRELSREYGASPDAVDQAIRRTLRNAWASRFRDTPGWEQFFPGWETCPSNWVFLSTLAGFLRKKYPSRFRKGSGSS